MQIAGIVCGICSQSVLLETDGTWCARCQAVFHQRCIATRIGQCPTCRQTFDPRDAHFIFAQMCPECFRSNDPRVKKCVNCGASTRWDSRADYDAFVEQAQATSRRYLARGVGELALGILCLFAFIVVFLISLRASFLFLYGTLMVFFILVTDGCSRISKSRNVVHT
jgi:hypothetical protein